MTIVAPLPPGSIDRHNSSFHPEKLHLKWAIPPNNTKVDSYSITISHPSSSYTPSSQSSNELLTNHRFKPGTNYTVTIRSRSYSINSQPHIEEFQTLREFALSNKCIGNFPIRLANCIYTFFNDIHVSL